MASPVTYMLDGVQYVTVMSGWGGVPGLLNIPTLGAVKPGFGRILTFAIGGTTKLEVPPFGHTSTPKPAIHMTASPDTVHEGRLLYGAHCFRCHGINAVAGSLPDLRYATAGVHKQFSAIVLGGARESRGMPSFKDLLDQTQLCAIQAFILSRAEESAHPSGRQPAALAPSNP